MVFSSIVFIFTFLPAVILACYLAPVKLRNFVLLLASLVFYAWGEPVYLFLMLYSILFNYVMGLDIAAKQEKGRTGRGSFALGVAVNLVLLGFFKYYGFLAQNLLQLFSIRLPEVTVGLPIGLSFYTFQSISYLADVYRGKAGGQRSLISFGLYISMFPQLVAGPIVQYADIDAQLRKRFTSWELFGEGTRYFVGGLAKKVLLANNLGAVFEAVSGLSSLSVLSAWVGALAYAFQIYFDFSGYSDMAIGLGKMFGFAFKENFHFPYCARSITEFWRRWHISLGSWFREYVYIPMGGNREGTGRLVRNLLAVWLLTGLWHGNGWNFVLWGLVLGGIIILEKLTYGSWLKRRKVISHIYVLALLPLTWMIFAITDLKELGIYFARLFPFFGIGQTLNAGDIWKYLSLYWPFLLAGAVCCVPALEVLYEKWKKTWPAAVLLMLLFWAAVYRLSISAGNPFLYFSF